MFGHLVNVNVKMVAMVIHISGHGGHGGHEGHGGLGGHDVRSNIKMYAYSTWW